jgi:cysteine desulfurase
MSVYLDYNATTPCDERVVEAMLPYFNGCFGNAASVDHDFGHTAQVAVEAARADVAALVGADPAEIIFTSGATEANNIAILGAMARAPDDSELVVSAVEHPSVLEAARTLGSRLSVVGVSENGVVDPDEVRRAISRRTALVSVMTANNETGVVQPTAEIGRICREADVPFHTDAVQAGARMRIDVDTFQASLLSLSAHKMYGPKGVGALYVRRRRPRPRLAPVLFGGGHERNLRPGTLNVPGIVGFGVAARLVRSQGEEDWARERMLLDRLRETLESAHPMTVHGEDVGRLPQTMSVRFHGIDARALMRSLAEHVAVSSGSACSTTSVEPSPVLVAQGLDGDQIAETVRLSLGRMTTAAEIDLALDAITPAIERLRGLARASAA